MFRFFAVQQHSHYCNSEIPNLLVDQKRLDYLEKTIKLIENVNDTLMKEIFSLMKQEKCLILGIIVAFKIFVWYNDEK